MSYYTKLFGKQFDVHIDAAAWEHIELSKHVSLGEDDLLTLPVTNNEIFFALFTIVSDKAPGTYGFSSHFFKCC